jgi:hypothetical protein
MSVFSTKFKYLFVSLFFVSQLANAQKFLVPDEAILQYAGSIGYLSVGGGYKLFKNERGNLDFLYGYVPASAGGRLHIEVFL